MSAAITMCVVPWRYGAFELQHDLALASTAEPFVPQSLGG
jgi:hypothetical protein